MTNMVKSKRPNIQLEKGYCPIFRGTEYQCLTWWEKFQQTKFWKYNFFYIFQENGFTYHVNCLHWKLLNYFKDKINKNIISLLSAEFAQRGVRVNIESTHHVQPNHACMTRKFSIQISPGRNIHKDSQEEYIVLPESRGAEVVRML